MTNPASPEADGGHTSIGGGGGESVCVLQGQGDHIDAIALMDNRTPE